MSKVKIFIIAIAVLFAVVIIGILGFAAAQPDSFKLQRSLEIKAPSKNIYSLINDFHKWGSWSPWEKMEPAMIRTYNNVANGKGSVYEWEGKKVGKGRMEITGAAPFSKISINLDFIKPFEAHNKIEFTLDTKGDATIVTWAMFGPNSYMAKIMHLFINMDSMVGKDFESGLANLKNVSEKH
jgi:hypothetical protein